MFLFEHMTAVILTAMVQDTVFYGFRAPELHFVQFHINNALMFFRKLGDKLMYRDNIIVRYHLKLSSYMSQLSVKISMIKNTFVTLQLQD